jgi:hypothetical protein
MNRSGIRKNSVVTYELRRNSCEFRYSKVRRPSSAPDTFSRNHARRVSISRTVHCPTIAMTTIQVR